MARPTLVNYDAFAKTVDDAKVKTSSGGIITLICTVFAVFLLMNEYRDYKAIVNRPELVVDRDRSKKLDINVDVSFPHMPCDLLTLDILDVSGDLQVDLLKSGFTKIRLDEQGREIAQESYKVNLDIKELTKPQDDYCGSCYGALPQNQNEEKEPKDRICCNSCEAVRQAYAQSSWAFFDGENIEQCEKEGYVERINQRLSEGCRIKGTAEINRIAGNLHFSPGASLTGPRRHSHDLSLFDKHERLFDFDHTIHHFSFGPDPNQKLVQTTKNDVVTSTQPLDNVQVILADKYHLFSYFLKVVASRYEFLNGEKLETNQFSSTYHDRPLSGGRDDDHPNTMHARGGIPGVFFHFDISPLKIINKEQYAKTWGAFLLGACASIGGVLTVGAVLDRTIWAADRMIRSKKDT